MSIGADAVQPDPIHGLPRDVPAEPVIPNIPWRQFLNELEWRQGEHVTLIGPTQVGKTTVIEALLPQRPYVLFLITKKQDAVHERIRHAGYQQFRTPQDWANRQIIYPPFPPRHDEQVKEHREVFGRALAFAYQSGGWTVVADEARYLSEDLGLSGQLKMLWMQGAAMGLTLVAATQRPRHLPLEAYDQPTHLFLWHDSDHGNVQRLSEIGGRVDKPLIQRTVKALPHHDFLYVNTRTGQTAISNAREVANRGL